MRSRHRHRHHHCHHRTHYRRKFHFYRSRQDALLFGVCGGIAEQYDWSPWAVRCAAILLQCTVFPWLILVYLIAGLFMKPAPRTPFQNFEEEEIYNSYQTSRSDALNKIRRTSDNLNQRLQRLESIVTSPSFKYENEFKNL
jgi:phage shock protein C